MLKKVYEGLYIAVFLKSRGYLTKCGGGIPLVMLPNAYTQVLKGKLFYAIVKL